MLGVPRPSLYTLRDSVSWLYLTMVDHLVCALLFDLVGNEPNS
jgi:hypothetical protein